MFHSHAKDFGLQSPSPIEKTLPVSSNIHIPSPSQSDSNMTGSSTIFNRPSTSLPVLEPAAYDPLSGDKDDSDGDENDVVATPMYRISSLATSQPRPLPSQNQPVGRLKRSQSFDNSSLRSTPSLASTTAAPRSSSPVSSLGKSPSRTSSSSRVALTMGFRH